MFAGRQLSAGATCWFTPGAAYELAAPRGGWLITVGCAGPTAAACFAALGPSGARRVLAARTWAEELWREAIAGAPRTSAAAEMLLRLWILELERAVQPEDAPGARLVAEVQRRMAERPAHDVAAAAAVAGVTPTHLARLFRRHVGISPQAWLHRIRRERAITRLAEDRPIASIAIELGYADASAFGKAFRRWTGRTPAGRG